MDASVFFGPQGPRQLLELYQTDRLMIEQLVGTQACTNIASRRFVLGRVLGEGNFGTAFLVRVAGVDPPVEFVAKRVTVRENEDILYEVPHDAALGELAKLVAARGGVPEGLIVARNGGDRDRIVREGEDLRVPDSVGECKRKTDTAYESNVDGAPQVAPKGSFVCSSEPYVEFLIALVVSQLSPGFPMTFSFAVCPSPPKGLNYSPIHEYIFMERLDGTMVDALRGKTPYEWVPNHRRRGLSVFAQRASDLAQVLFAMCQYQRLEISHNDLHDGNIFFTRLTKKSRLGGRKLAGYDYLEFDMGDGCSFYLPRGDRLIKLGDWGLAAKFSPPRVQSLANWDVVPNVFRPNFDLLCVLKVFLDVEDELVEDRKVARSDSIRPQLVDMLTYCLGMSVEDLGSPRFADLWQPKTLSWRPKVELLDTFPAFTAEDILRTRDFFGELYERPAGKILVVGRLGPGT